MSQGFCKNTEGTEDTEKRIVKTWTRLRGFDLHPTIPSRSRFHTNTNNLRVSVFSVSLPPTPIKNPDFR